MLRNRRSDISDFGKEDTKMTDEQKKDFAARMRAAKAAKRGDVVIDEGKPAAPENALSGGNHAFGIRGRR